MSPLLEISLAIVFCLWVIPLTWAFTRAVRALPGLVKGLIQWTIGAPANLIAYIRNAPARYEMYVTSRQLSLENKALESDYQRLQDELIAHRQLVAHAVATKDALESRFRKLTEVTQELQSKSNQSTASHEELERLATNLESLLQLERDRGAHELKLHSLRIELDEKEAAVQAAYTTKLVLIATNKADAASKIVKQILASDGAAVNTIRRMEEKVALRETKAYAIFFIDDHYVSFPSVAKSIARLAIEKLELEELKELLEALDQAASELHTIVQAAISYERVLRLQAETSAEEAMRWANLAEEAEREGRRRDAAESKQWQAKYAESSEDFKTMVESSRICSLEFTQMHTNFAQKEREIFNQMAKLELQSAKDSDDEEKDSDLSHE
jgi:hypothetical protein